jgi:predicted DCC family thiol-disulfide oxidoreductase YuxK
MLILFDGVCNLCNSTVLFLIKRDPAGKFRFASLQSARGQAEMKRFNVDPERLDSIIVVEGDRYFDRSNAALKIATALGGMWSLFSLFYVFPRFLRDPVYNLLSRNRYRIFGKKNECMIPTPELRSRFVE